MQATPTYCKSSNIVVEAAVWRRCPTATIQRSHSVVEEVQECPRKVLDSGHVNISTSLQLNFLGAVFLCSKDYI